MSTNFRTASGLPRPAILLSACLILLCLAFLSLFVDYEISSVFRSADLPGDVAKAIQLSEAFAHGFGALTILTALLVGATSYRGPLVFAVILTATSGVTANGLKSCFVRIRPYAHEQLMVAGGSEISLQVAAPSIYLRTVPEYDAHKQPDRQAEERDVELSYWDARIRSFPSGHAATACGLALGLSFAFRQVWWLFGMLALLSCVQRISCGAHFPSDVLAGAAIAFGISAGLANLPFCRQLFRDPSDLRNEPGSAPTSPA